MNEYQDGYRDNPEPLDDDRQRHSRNEKYIPPSIRGVGVKIALVLLALCVVVVGGVYLYQKYRLQWEMNQYPLYYEEIVARQAQVYDLDPYEVMAVIHVESHGRPMVRSQDNAIGLMQVIPSTGEWIAEKLGEKESFSEGILEDPETNIRYGCWYLRFLHDRFSEPQTVWAAYNAGQGKVYEWLENPEVSADGNSLIFDNIPAGETKAYVPKVQEAYDKYRELYPEAFAATETETINVE